MVLRLALAAIVLAVFSHTRADPDLWGHVRFGRDIAAARTVHVPDRYSFTSDRPWINHEWLAESAMYEAYALSGGPGLVALKLALMVAMLAAVMWRCRTAGLPVMSSDLLVGLVVVGTVPQANHVRPQLFSLTLFAWLLAVLTAAEDGRRRLLPIAVAILAVWANLHGGWILGLGTLAVWSGGSWLSRGSAKALAERHTAPAERLKASTAKATADKSAERWILTAVVLLAAVATLINPYGWHLWSFIVETVGFNRADISEWQPMPKAGAFVAMMWCAFAAATVAAGVQAIKRRAYDLRAFAVVLMLALMSFRVNRLLAFFAIAVVMLVGPYLSALVERSPEVAAAPRPMPKMAMAAVLSMAIALAAGGLTVSARNAGCVRMDLPIFPDAGMAAAIAERQLRGRMLTWFDWGEYAIWHFAPAVAVSIDGRRETVYSDAVIAEHLRFYFDPERRGAILDALNPDYIWLPSNLEVTGRLQSDGWKPIVSGPTSVLLARNGDRPLTGDVEGQSARCFPGP